MGRRGFIAAAFALVVPTAQAAGIFEFGTAERTLISTSAGAPPGTGSFADVPGFTTALFEVGNLFNGCGLFPGQPSSGRSGTACPLTDHNTPSSMLSGAITYTDTFFLAQPTQGSLQIIVKLGHPETVTGGNRDQNQTEQFNVFLESGTELILLAELLDDVSSGAPDLEEDDAYYRYVYAAAEIPAGTWRPVFMARDGSIEFLTRLSAQQTSVPVPGSLWLLAAALTALAFARRRTA
jgi:hypothetical protein